MFYSKSREINSAFLLALFILCLFVTAFLKGMVMVLRTFYCVVCPLSLCYYVTLSISVLTLESLCKNCRV